MKDVKYMSISIFLLLIDNSKTGNNNNNTYTKWRTKKVWCYYSTKDNARHKGGLLWWFF